MPKILTSWKEIGEYLGKGVRTVQRWEQEAGLPVRRREGSARHAVLAMPDELDDWARSRTRGPAGPVAELLRREIARLREQIADLTDRLACVEKQSAADSQQRPGTLARSPVPRRAATRNKPGPDLWTANPCFGNDAAVERSQWIAHRAVHAAQGRAHMIRTRLAFVFTLCAMAEDGYRRPHFGVTQRARQSIRRIREALDQPDYVPIDELEELRAQLAELEMRIELVGEPSSETQDAETP